MTKGQLESEANGLITVAKAIVELQGEFPFTIVIHVAGEWRNLEFPEKLAPLMNDGGAKDLIFGAVRKTVQDSKADGVIFASDTWMGETTAEGMKHYDTPEWKELHDFGFVKLVQRGWVKRSEAITVTAQSATDVLIIRQKYQRLGSGTVQLLDGNRYWNEQAKFSGRQKMFGDLSWQNLGSEAAVKGESK